MKRLEKIRWVNKGIKIGRYIDKCWWRKQLPTWYASVATTLLELEIDALIIRLKAEFIGAF